MTKKQKAARSMNSGSKQKVKTTRSEKESYGRSGARAARPVTPTSERIIKATSVKRRTAMKVLANR